VLNSVIKNITEQFSDKKLSPKEYWDEVLKSAHLPRCHTRDNYNYSVTMDFVEKSIRSGKYKTFIEIGCGSSGWLPYFAKTYNLLVSGLDYSKIGCRLCEENLKMQNIAYDEIICKDIFSPNCTNGKKYDIVFTYGVIEHFNHPNEIMQIIISLLNPNGLCITLVPNINGINGVISTIFVKEIYDMHYSFTKESLQESHRGGRVDIVTCEYAGNFTFAVLPLIRSKLWIIREGTLRSKIFNKMISIIDRIITSFYRALKINMPSKLYSPYIICIAEKK